MADVIISLDEARKLAAKIRQRDRRITELETRVAALTRQLEQARNLATRRIVAYGEKGMVKITPDDD